MYCYNCGKEIIGRFCSYCGVDISSVMIPTQKEKINDKIFTIQKEIEHMYIDYANKLWQIKEFYEDPSPIYSFSEIIKIELIQDGKKIDVNSIKKIINTSKVGLFLRLIEFITLGMTARRPVVNYCRILDVKIYTNRVDIPFELLHIISDKIRTDSCFYISHIKKARKLFFYLKNEFSC